MGVRDLCVGLTPDLADLTRICEGRSWVFHLEGGFRGVGRETPDRLNREGTARLLDAILRCKRRPERLVFASSAAVYGDRSSLWVDEDFAPNPQTRFGSSKAAAEELLLEAWRRGDLEPVVARLATVYGRGHAILMEDAIRRGKAWLPGEGSNLVPLVHEQDAAAALVRIAEAGRPGGVYHVAGRDQPSLTDFYKAVASRVQGRPPRFWSTYVPSYVQHELAAWNERVQSRISRRPAFTPDFLRFFTASVRLKVDLLEQELGFHWRHPDFEGGLDAVFSAPTDGGSTRIAPGPEGEPRLEDWTIRRVIETPGAAALLEDVGLGFCQRCPVAGDETLAEAARAHGLGDLVTRFEALFHPCKEEPPPPPSKQAGSLGSTE
jgi:nucleoside-diphosphate-sugar epimerase